MQNRERCRTHNCFFSHNVKVGESLKAFLGVACTLLQRLIVKRNSALVSCTPELVYLRCFMDQLIESQQANRPTGQGTPRIFPWHSTALISPMFCQVHHTSIPQLPGPALQRKIQLAVLSAPYFKPSELCLHMGLYGFVG